jgi:hypothetical protein
MRTMNALIRRPSNLIVPTGDYPAEVTQVALQRVKSGKNAGRLAFFVTFTADVGEESPVNGLADYLLVLPLDTKNPQVDKINADRIWSLIKTCGVVPTTYNQLMTSIGELCEPDESTLEALDAEVRDAVADALADCVGSTITLRLVQASWKSPDGTSRTGMNVDGFRKTSATITPALEPRAFVTETSSVPVGTDDDD